VATLAVHWIARVLGALISVDAIDSGAQHRVFANASSTKPRETSEVTCGAVHHVGVATLTIHWIARVLGALISVVAIDAGTQHRVFTNASSTNPWKTSEIAGRPIGDVRMRTLAVRRVAGVGGALVLIIAVDVRAQHTATSTAGATPAASTTSTTVAERGRFTTGVGAIKEPVRVVVSAIFAVPWLGSFDASSSKVTTALATTAHADHRNPQTGSTCRNAPHEL
jgi:hypothetical protein